MPIDAVERRQLQSPCFFLAGAGDPSMEASGGGDQTGAAAKSSWPELAVGVSSSEAKKKVEEDKPGVRVQVVPADAFVTMDYDAGRVRIFVDANDKVARAPKIG